MLNHAHSTGKKQNKTEQTFSWMIDGRLRCSRSWSRSFESRVRYPRCVPSPMTGLVSDLFRPSVVSAIPPKTLNIATADQPKPKRAVGSVLVPLALFLMSLPFGFLASVMAVVLYVPLINCWLNKNYLTVHIAL